MAAGKGSSPPRAALKWANELDGPCVLEFMTSPEENVFPMVPAGAALDDLLEAEV